MTLLKKATKLAHLILFLVIFYGLMFSAKTASADSFYSGCDITDTSGPGGVAPVDTCSSGAYPNAAIIGVDLIPSGDIVPGTFGFTIGSSYGQNNFCSSRNNALFNTSDLINGVSHYFDLSSLGCSLVNVTNSDVVLTIDTAPTGGYFFVASNTLARHIYIIYHFAQLPSCSDGTQNQDETGVDVGGVCAPKSTPHNPVLIIPGVLGTEISKGSDKLWLDLAHNLKDVGDQFMDPLQFNSDLTPSDTSLSVGDVIRKITVNIDIKKVIVFDYTGSLIKEFTDQGYNEGKDLFLFPYDWRNGVSENTVNQLKQKIQDIKTQTGTDKVDIVAHSTGGLLVKKYVIENQNNNFIDKVVFVGVPNTGAPKAIKALIFGDSFGVPLLADEEMKKIAKNLPVVYDLSPSQQYFDTKGSYVKILNKGLLSSSSKDLNFDEMNEFLTADHNLSAQALVDAHHLHTIDFDNYDLRNAGIDLYAIDGCRTGTMGKLIEEKLSAPIIGTYATSDQLEFTPGDGTVPLESSTNLPINQDHKYYSLEANHGEMLTQNGTRQQIVNLISSSNLDVPSNLVTKDISECNLNGEAISVFSPLSIDIVDQDGNHSGLSSDGVSIENNIPNADFEIFGEHKFLYLPTDEGQTYTITTKGTGDGTFTIKDQDITDNHITQTEVFSNIPVTKSLAGTINLGNTTTLSLDNNGDGTVDQTVTPSSIINSNQSEDLIPPTSSTTIAGTSGQPNFYRSDVNISLSIIDPIITGQENQTSGVLKTVYKLDSDTAYTQYTNPITVSSEGPHTIKFFATDKAGNNEIEQSLSFTINKTAPEFLIQFNQASKDLQFTGADNTSNASNINISDQDETITLTDQAGNISQMKLKDKNRKSSMKAEIKSLAYNNQPVDITKNTLAFDWKLDKQQNLTELNQHVKSKKDFNIDAIYKNGQTILTGKDQNGKINKTLSSIVLLKISTDKGDLNWSY